MNAHAAVIRFSPQQAEFINWAENGRGSCVLEAVAGAGKTTTILAAAERVSGTVAILAYNKKIADEISGKLAARGVSRQKVEAGTVHSFGFRAYRRAFPGCRVDDRKVEKIAADVLSGDDRVKPGDVSGIVKLVSLAKQAGVGLDGARIGDRKVWSALVDHFDPLADAEMAPHVAIGYAIEILRASNAMTAVIDFDDMVFLPLIHGAPFYRFDMLMVDEAQDTNAARRLILSAMLKRGGRVVAVGDSRQAIYGFTGADANSLDLIADRFDCVRMPLTVTYRCPKAVVAFARTWVSHITAADSAPKGAVYRMEALDFSVAAHAGALDGTCAILSRVTRPLVATAYKLIAAGVACRVEGRDIGTGLKKLAAKWKRVKTAAELVERLDTYVEAERERLSGSDKGVMLQSIEDRVATLTVIAENVIAAGDDARPATVQDVVDAIDGLFADNVSGILTLSTIHKSKGREWPNVFWLDMEGTCPSPMAKRPWEMQQEDNLCYVAATRAQDSLILLPNLGDADLDYGDPVRARMFELAFFATLAGLGDGAS